MTLEELAKRVHDIDHMLERAVPNLADRVTKLEANAQVAGRLADHIVSPERDRQARWHATYDAAVQGLIGGSASNWELLNADKLHDAASLVADRAHGPLENKAPASVETDRGARSQSASLEAFSVTHVNALVKAARECFAWYEAKPGSRACFERLHEALKPFEVA